MEVEDRKLLELAAKAAGIELKFRALTNMPGCAETVFSVDSRGITERWNPLESDGDALRLAVTLSLRVEPYTGVKMGSDDLSAVANITDVYSLHSTKISLSERHNLDPHAATRRAIVRAAAELGWEMS